MHRIYKHAGTFLLLGSLVLGCWEGRVALFTKGVSHPVRVYPYRAELLPPVDRAALEAGIPVENETHLDQLLEDYLS